MNEPYYSFSSFLKKKYPNQKIRKIPINAGFSCPNKDGTLSGEGCIFCDEYGSGPLKTYTRSIGEQINFFRTAHPGLKYIAYYQAHTNTNAPAKELRKKYEIIFRYPDIVSLFIGTRPDSIRDEVYPLLEELNNRTYLCVELGLQSIHEKSLKFLRRNHNYSQFLKTFTCLKELNIDVVIHLITGIPGETGNDMLATVKEMNRLHPAGVKFHLMHILKNTPLYDLYKKERFQLLHKEQYINLTISLLENLAPDIVVHRLTGERDREIFYAPEWALKKGSTINAIRGEMIRKNTYQGINLTL